MKTLLPLTLLGSFLLLSNSPARAQCGPAARRQLAAVAELRGDELENLVRDTARAVQLKNPSFFNRVYSEDFFGIAPNGIVLDKNAMIAYVGNSPATYTTLIATNVRIRVYEDTAVVTSVWSARGTQDGRSFSRQSRVIQIYVYALRGWQVVSSQETLLPG
ncbi:MAG: nuclear transport factor 2 family protein [Candidatus Acidiferrum sp.]|jgi:hypothetical protein